MYVVHRINYSARDWSSVTSAALEVERCEQKWTIRHCTVHVDHLATMIRCSVVDDDNGAQTIGQKVVKYSWKY